MNLPFHTNMAFGAAQTNLFFFFKPTTHSKPDTVVHAFKPSTWETEAGGSLWVQGQPGRHSEFQANQDYMVRSCLKYKQNKPKPKQQNSHFKSGLFLFVCMCRHTCCPGRFCVKSTQAKVSEEGTLAKKILHRPAGHFLKTHRTPGWQRLCEALA